METILSYMERYDYENVFICQDRNVGLKAIIAIHDTTLGPATGGCRMWTYDSEWDAIKDALRLARGMTYKYAVAGVNLGGGKAVVLGDPRTQKSEALFRVLGRFINRLGGIYITGEDVGTTLRDMEYMRMETPYVVTLPEAMGGAGPISPATARGVIQAMKACANAVYGEPTLRGRRVAVQGVGAVGYHVVEYLVEAGARVVVSDIDEDRVQRVVNEFGVDAADPAAIHAVECDVFCPCALGAIINDRTLPELRCRIVCGSANNQLAEARHGDALEGRGILYAPDYVANGGGTIFDTDRLRPGGFNRERALGNVDRIFETMCTVIGIARSEGIPTYLAADRLAERRIEGVRKARALASKGEVNL